MDGCWSRRSEAGDCHEWRKCSFERPAGYPLWPDEAHSAACYHPVSWAYHQLLSGHGSNSGQCHP